MYFLKGEEACMVIEVIEFAVDAACISDSACSIHVEKTACILHVEKTACILLAADTAHIPHAEDTARMLLVDDSFAHKLPAGNMAALLLHGHNFRASCLVVLLSLPPQTFY